VKFKVDENLPSDAARALRQAGFSADTVQDEGLSGADDTEAAGVARQEQRVLLTLDLDFSNIRAYPPESYAGIIVLRPKSQNKPVVLALLARLIGALRKEKPAGELWIVEPDRIRYRRPYSKL
jgi:predicted nuclease of predicted toxin-antitoxin system